MLPSSAANRAQSSVHCHFRGPHPAAGPFQPKALTASGQIKGQAGTAPSTTTPLCRRRATMAAHPPARSSPGRPGCSAEARAPQAPGYQCYQCFGCRAGPLALTLARERGPRVAERIQFSNPTILLSPARNILQKTTAHGLCYCRPLWGWPREAGVHALWMEGPGG
jgi:hypothetical protein